MRCWRGFETHRRLAHLAALLWLPLLAACHGGGHIEAARIEPGLTPALDLRLRLTPSATLLDALDHGVPLVLRLDVGASAPGTRLHTVRRIELRYLPLAGRYAWTDLDVGTTRLFARRALLLAALDRIRLPLDATWRDLPAGSRCRVSLALDVDALPAPLRVPALFSPQWRLATADHRWIVGA